MKEKRLRNSSLDIVRIVALFSVISVHFFLNINYYYVPVQGERMLIMTCVRTMFMSCVPLFLILSGYLMYKKQLSGRYYLGIVKTLGVYLLASVACLLFKAYYIGDSITLRSAVLGIFDFSAANYSWYVEMYIGLFLIIPFLNVMYHGMQTKGRKLALIATFLFLSSAFTVFNIFDFHTEGWWQNPSASVDFDELVPDFWIEIYPITLYLIGCFIADYKVKMKRIPNLILIALVTCALGAFSFYRSHGRHFVWGHWQSWGALGVVAISVLIFIFISGFDLTRVPAWLSKSLKVISDSVLGAYLVSYIFDTAFYKQLNEAVPEMYQRYNYYPVIVPVVFVCSIALSMLINGVWWCISKPVGAAIGKLWSKARHKKGEER